MLAAAITATYFSFCGWCMRAYFLTPATLMAPVGSMSERVSPNTSLMAEQISSVETVTTSSTRSLHSRKFSTPTLWMPTSSVKRFTSGNATRSPRFMDSCRRLAPSVSTPTILTDGATSFTKAAMPAIRPPPPTGAKIASGHCPAVYDRHTQTRTAMLSLSVWYVGR